MTRDGQSLLHQIYPTEVLGDTAVLRPRGDAAGFAMHLVSVEFAHVRDLILSGKVRHLLIDLGNDRYFGSMVIGDLIELAQLVRSRGGRTGICEVSDDMSSVLRLMQLDDQWEEFPTRAAGIQALATVPLRQRAWKWRYVVTGLTAMLLLVAGVIWYPRPNYARTYHERLTRLWRDVSEKRTQVGIDEWNFIAQRNRDQLQPVVDHLDKLNRRQRATISEQYLLLATKYHWLPWLSGEGADADRNRLLVQYYLDMADALENGRPQPKLPEAALAENTSSETPIDDGLSQQSGVEQPTPAEQAIVPVSGSNDDGVSSPEPTSADQSPRSI